MQAKSKTSRRAVSRGPVLVLVAGGALALILVLLGASLAADPAPTPAPGQSPGAAQAPRSVNVIMRDYRFDPTPLYLYPGETIQLRVLNGGLVEHELVLGDREVQEAWAFADAVATPPAPFATAPRASVDPGVGGLRLLLGSGASGEAFYSVPADASLQLVCHLPGHAERGMVGQIVLVEQLP